MVNCCVLQCHSRTHDRNGKPLRNGLSFFRFPSWKQHQGAQISELTKTRRMAWIAAVRREDITFTNISANMFVCSRHFHSGKPAYEMIQCDPDWVPSLHLGHTEVDVANSNDPYQQKTKKLQAPAPVSDKQFTEDCKGKSMKSLTKWRRRRQILYTGWQPVTRRISQVHNSSHAAEVRHDHDYSKNPQSEQATQTELDHLEEGVLNSNRVLLQRLQFEPELITFYTGFKDYSTLKAFYSALQPTPEIIWKWKRTLELSYTERSAADYGGFPEQRLCLFDQLFLFLCFVRRGFLPVDVSKQLMSEDVVRTTYVTWCHYLFFMLGALPIWSTRQTVDELMPPFFRTTFPKTRVVLDMTEIHVQPPAHKAKSSHHKASKTLKSLFGVSPSGAISFVSGVFSSSVSDEDVIRESGILNLLEPGDKVMADKSLDVGDVLDVISVNFVTPTFSWPNGQLNKDNMTHTQDISCLKIHVARAISRVKEYHIFDDVPSALCGSVSQLWTVCALLTNFHGPLV
ncbi:uncharacterized protein LOC108872680 isoform X2 [Lates calcarifer]|uniref:Uncharacterized protein LOC108872680 isoform X2 n=1 Tax=Lates calcarifer TaxID=8187 RepID=A0AAJ7L7Q2_LATCA|nr:uncharacterized protein LOC108872680 isoform X2 [Lates calcarifer]